MFGGILGIVGGCLGLLSSATSLRWVLAISSRPPWLLGTSMLFACLAVVLSAVGLGGGLKALNRQKVGGPLMLATGLIGYFVPEISLGSGGILLIAGGIIALIGK